MKAQSGISILALIGIFLSVTHITVMAEEFILPEPKLKSDKSLEQTISQRRSVRAYKAQELELEQISQLLWSAQGITEPKKGLRSAPSAGALYPAEIYLVKADGIFHYLPKTHSLSRVSGEDVRQRLCAACRGQACVSQAPINIVITMVYERLEARYGERAARYADIEVGHIAQNLHLQAVALGLASVPVGAFDDNEVKNVLGLGKQERPLYIIPVGYPR